MSPFPPPFIISPISTHTHTLILLHDRSSLGQSFALEYLNATDTSGHLLQTIFPGTKFIFPTALAQCVTSQGGVRTNQWFDNFSNINPTEREALQFKGLRESCRFIHGLVDAEAECGVPLKNVFLGGFGMGSAMALYALLCYRSEREGQHGGFVGMSGWLPLRGSLDGLIEYALNVNKEGDEGFDVNVQFSTLLRNQIGLPPTDASIPMYDQMPLFFGHGEADEEISMQLAKDAAKSLDSLGLDVILKEYPDLRHAWRNGDEVDDIVAFLSAQGMG